MKSPVLSVLFLTLLIAPVFAAECTQLDSADPAVPNVFSAGQPAVADDVNANFDCLADELGPLQVNIKVDASGNVGIGTTTPPVKLAVNGEIKIGNSAAACTSAMAGSMRYNSTSNAMEYCNATAWIEIAPAMDPEIHRFWRLVLLSSPPDINGNIDEMKFFNAGAEITYAASQLSGTAGAFQYVAGCNDNLFSTPTFNSLCMHFASFSMQAGGWMAIDFGVGNEQAVTEVRLRTTYHAPTEARFDVQYSDDGTSYTTIYANWDLTGTQASWATVVF